MSVSAITSVGAIPSKLQDPQRGSVDKNSAALGKKPIKELAKRGSLAVDSKEKSNLNQRRLLYFFQKNLAGHPNFSRFQQAAYDLIINRKNSFIEALSSTDNPIIKAHMLNLLASSPILCNMCGVSMDRVMAEVQELSPDDGWSLDAMPSSVLQVQENPEMEFMSALSSWRQLDHLQSDVEELGLETGMNVKELPSKLMFGNSISNAHTGEQNRRMWEVHQWIEDFKAGEPPTDGDKSVSIAVAAGKFLFEGIMENKFGEIVWIFQQANLSGLPSKDYYAHSRSQHENLPASALRLIEELSHSEAYKNINTQRAILGMLCQGG